jgi:phospholipase C
MIIYYDEHGGFFDHVQPEPIHDQTTGPDPYTFETTGPRIPGLLLSPFVSPGSVCSATLDHTSVLQLLAEKFTPDRVYSDRVDARRKAGIQSVLVALDTASHLNPPSPPPAPVVQTPLGAAVLPQGPSDMQQSFLSAATHMMSALPDETTAKFPELVALKESPPQS